MTLPTEVHKRNNIGNFYVIGYGLNIKSVGLGVIEKTNKMGQNNNDNIQNK